MKGSILGRRFEYTVPPPKTFSYRDDRWKEYVSKQHEMTNWCAEQKFDHWGTEGNTFWFYYEKDYMLFMLRWT